MKEETKEWFGAMAMMLIACTSMFVGGYLFRGRSIPTPRKAAVDSMSTNATSVVRSGIPVNSNIVIRGNTFRAHESYDERQIKIVQQAIERALKNVTIKTESVEKRSSIIQHPEVITNKFQSWGHTNTNTFTP